jgi:hypothetical protein
MFYNSLTCIYPTGIASLHLQSLDQFINLHRPHHPRHLHNLGIASFLPEQAFSGESSSHQDSHPRVKDLPHSDLSSLHRLPHRLHRLSINLINLFAWNHMIHSTPQS